MIGGLLTLALPLHFAQLAEPQILELSPKRHRDWKIELPNEEFTPVGDGIRLSGAGREFAVGLEGTQLLIDLDGDGKTDTKIEGDDGSVLLRSVDGFRYGLRLKRGPAGWAYATSSTMTGMLNGLKISIIDQDNDGKFGEIGEDAILVGRGRIATWLGETLLVQNELMQIAVSDNGSQISFMPFEGETGSLNLNRSFQGEGKVLSAVLRSSDGLHCFDVAAHSETVNIPVGNYRIVSGKVGLGTMAVTIGPGSGKSFSIDPEAEQSLSWGGPVRAEFRYQRQGDQVAFSPEQIRYFGEKGEEYLKWFPVGKSPVFIIQEADTKQEIARAMFPGSC